MIEKSGKKSLVDWGKKLRGDWAVTEKGSWAGKWQDLQIGGKKRAGCVKKPCRPSQQCIFWLRPVWCRCICMTDIMGLGRQNSSFTGMWASWRCP